MYIEKKQKKHGFTLLESIITVSIIAIILAVSIPLTISLFGSNRGDNYLHKVSRAIELAKITAISQNTATIICPSADGASCASIQNNNWGNNRIIVFASSTGDASQADHIITTINSPSRSDYLHWAGVGGVDFIRINQEGLSATNGTLSYCTILDDSAVFKHNHQLVINRLGRVRIDDLTTPQLC